MASWHVAKFRSAVNRNKAHFKQSGLNVSKLPDHTTVPHEVWHLNPIVRWYHRARSTLFPFTLRDLRKEDHLNPAGEDQDKDRDYSPPQTPKSYDNFGSEASEESLTPVPNTVIFGLRVDADNWTPSFNASHPLPLDSSSSEGWTSSSSGSDTECFDVDSDQSLHSFTSGATLGNSSPPSPASSSFTEDVD